MAGTRDGPLVSVVIPCYRQGRYLAAAVDSALGQTYPAVEVVVVNDGSDDDTDAVAARYGGRIRYLRQPNAGPSAARNAGVRAAAGDYLLFLDGDDALDPDAVARLVATARPAPGAVAVMGLRHFADLPGDLADPPVPPPPPGDAFAAVFFHGRPPLAYLCPRAVFERAGGFDERPPLRGHEDWEFWLRVAFDGTPFVPAPYVGGHYRRTPGSLSSDRARAAVGFAAVAAGMAERLAARPDLLALRGPLILRLVFGARMRVRVRCPDRTDLEADLTAAIGRLHVLGVRADAPLARVVQDRLPARYGDALEGLLVTALRVFRPALYRAL